MQTDHEVHVADARTLPLADDSVDLVVTSPPYPMIEMWDDLFCALNPTVEEALADADGERAFDLMHEALDAVWGELARVLAPGGVACVNVGDATRTLEEFALYPNGAELAGRLRDQGLTQLPGIRWRKPTNSGTKFMGSGMLPPNAYPTLEHEQILLFRNGGPRTLEPKADDRYEAAYFWEERNQWFSDLWTFTGTDQRLSEQARERSAAYPLELPLRLIRMFSTYGDRVFDPFWGTGTTALAAMVAGRDSVGVELDAGLVDAFVDRLADLPERTRERATDRLERHAAFAADHETNYEAEHYDFGVVTKQERRVRLYAVDGVTEADGGVTTDPVVGATEGGVTDAGAAEGTAATRRWTCEHSPVEF
ncbi:DNA-methyltransferase [Halomarina oriensis]|uniref:Type II methyltransferase n=1 Tax=Halomarina oriensis TaxID=671145 RepID=A0A6B0GU12_9EURY|nr:site-specific DNA-methyltransferase [Halomarina oriensis]MWG35615.1 site-specific DNA-methyltransferase [Halomarina oriensis]